MINITKLVAIKEISNTDENAHRTFTIDIKYGTDDGCHTTESPLKVAVLSRDEKMTLDGEVDHLVRVNDPHNDAEVANMLEALAIGMSSQCRTHQSSVDAHQADTTDTDDSADIFEVEAKWNEDIELDENGKVPSGTVLGHARLTIRDDVVDKLKSLSGVKPGYGLRYDKDHGATIVAL